MIENFVFAEAHLLRRLRAHRLAVAAPPAGTRPRESQALLPWRPCVGARVRTSRKGQGAGWVQARHLASTRSARRRTWRRAVAPSAAAICRAIAHCISPPPPLWAPRRLRHRDAKGTAPRLPHNCKLRSTVARVYLNALSPTLQGRKARPASCCCRCRWHSYLIASAVAHAAPQESCGARRALAPVAKCFVVTRCRVECVGENGSDLCLLLVEVAQQ